MTTKYNYPAEAVPVGTLVRSVKFDSLGVVTDAFEEGGVIYYTCFLIPNTSSRSQLNMGRHSTTSTNRSSIEGLLIEESEFDLVCYLMLGRVNLDNLSFFPSPADIML